MIILIIRVGRDPFSKALSLKRRGTYSILLKPEAIDASGRKSCLDHVNF